MPWRSRSSLVRNQVGGRNSLDSVFMRARAAAQGPPPTQSRKKKEVIGELGIHKFKGQPMQFIPGSKLLIADLLGDWREEIIVSTKGGQGQKPARQRIVGNRAESELPAHRQQFLFDAAADDIAHRLHHLDALPAVVLGQPQHLAKLPARVVRGRYAADLSLADQAVHRRQRFRQRRVVVGRMQVVDIEVVCLQPPQAAFDPVADGPGR
jgi:hypothetical protein